MLIDSIKFSFWTKNNENRIAITPHIKLKNLEIITSDIADNRTKMLDDYIEKIMSTVMNKNQDDKTRKAIQEYFQNHTTKLEFKI